MKQTSFNWTLSGNATVPLVPLLVCAIVCFQRHENSGPRSVWTFKQHVRASDLLKSPDLCSLWTSEHKGVQLSAVSDVCINLPFYLSASTCYYFLLKKNFCKPLCKNGEHGIRVQTHKHIRTCTSSHSELWLKLCLRNLHDNAGRTGLLHRQNPPRILTSPKSCHAAQAAACWLGIWEPPFCAGLGNDAKTQDSMKAWPLPFWRKDVTIGLKVNMKLLWILHCSLKMP